MPRKAFVADLQGASQSFTTANISHIRAGEDDGQVVFDHERDGCRTEIVALVPDLGDYPQTHSYMFFTNSDHVPQAVSKIIDQMPDCAHLRVSDMLSKVAKVINKSTVGSKANPVDLEGQAEDGMDLDPESGSDLQDAEPDDAYDSDDEAWSTKPARPRLATANNASPITTASARVQKVRMREDLRHAKDAGFRVSIIGSLAEGAREGFLLLSIRVAKLDISEEALDAWGMEPKQYLMILLRYTSGYQSLDDLVGSTVNGIQFRVGLCNHYKVDAEEAVEAFAKVEVGSNVRRRSDRVSINEKQKINRLFIGGPVEELLNARLIPLLKYRMGMGFAWQGAEDFFTDFQGRNLENDAPDPKYWAPEEPRKGIAHQDHLLGTHTQKSLPLVAMQFTLRHLVRCTEFCLVCHCKVEADFEALKPYVCSKPLCLYQYMNLGFGPSIEHEITSQPYVVDLLISFCYASAKAQRMKYLPTGLALMVPPPEAIPECQTTRVQSRHPYMTNREPQSDTVKANNASKKYEPYSAKIDIEQLELLFPNGVKRPPIHVGSWVAIHIENSIEPRFYCRVIECIYPIVRLAKMVQPPSKAVTEDNPRSDYRTPAASPTPPPKTSMATKETYQDVDFVIFDQNFDALDTGGKCSTMLLLLETLPSVTEMKAFLLSRGGQEATLRQWVDRIPPAALSLLRWIIASNRSCIVQVDNFDARDRKSEERVSGMAGWMQFRFAQGAPDKEQRFVTSMRETTAEFNFPTLFAWHGSPLYNWHGIVREGLHFEQTDHGRAYGHGVYHAMDASTSIGYTGAMWPGGRNSTMNGQWPNSQLKISAALALNEIINAPEQFVHSSGSNSNILVIAQLDWIQTRYLFVQCNVDGWQTTEANPTQLYEQDPKRHPRGMKNESIQLPITAVSKARRPQTTKPDQPVSKKIKIDLTAEDAADIVSDETDMEDIAIFFSDAEEEPQAEGGTQDPKSQASSSALATRDPSMTNFDPGSLDTSTLTLLDPPSYATPIATKSLQRELQSTLKIQNNTPHHQLGWYINPDLITNVYQWIVELHSFDKTLPLAKDMTDRKINSIVIEVRFGAAYPMSPPFIRVLRPRFRSFAQGGGGHVTAGGALCMELLTNSGWSAVSSIDSVLLQVRLAISSTEPPARLAPSAGAAAGAGSARSGKADYGVGEAVEAFVRACQMHGWEVPRDFRENYLGGRTAGV